MIFEIIRGGGELTGWGKNGQAYFFPGERMGWPILSAGKKLNGGGGGGGGEIPACYTGDNSRR